VSDRNDAELQRLFIECMRELGMPSPERNLVVQIQHVDLTQRDSHGVYSPGLDLMLRCRYRCFRRDTHLLSGGFQLSTEHPFDTRLAGEASADHVLNWIRISAWDSLTLARTQMERDGFEWPREFPNVAPLPQAVLA
jgi:hypothetical protein